MMPRQTKAHPWRACNEPTAYMTKRYRIRNRITGEWWEGEADSAQEACRLAGWLIGDCWVRQKTPVVLDPSSESGSRGGGWKKV